MKKKFLPILFLAVSAFACAGTLSGCSIFARERPRDMLAKMELVEVDDRGYVRYRGEIVKPGEFANLIRASRKEVCGKPVLLSVNPEVYERQPAVVPYLRRVLESVNVGKIYTELPSQL